MAEVISNMDEHNRRLEQAIKKALRLVGGQAERIAKETISDMEAVDTGFLRNSITYALAGEPANAKEYQDDAGNQQGEYDGDAPEDEEEGVYTVYIGTNVFYAPYVELGTSKMSARPFLTTAVQGQKDAYIELFKKAFEAFR